MKWFTTVLVLGCFLIASCASNELESESSSEPVPGGYDPELTTIAPEDSAPPPPIDPAPAPELVNPAPAAPVKKAPKAKAKKKAAAKAKKKAKKKSKKNDAH